MDTTVLQRRTHLTPICWYLYSMSNLSAEQFEAEMSKKRSEDDNVGATAAGTAAAANGP